MKSFFNSLGCSNLNYLDNSYLNNDFSFLISSSLSLLNKSKVFLILGSNVKLESPILNSRLRRLYLDKKQKCVFFSVGLALMYLTFPVINIKNNTSFFVEFAESKSFNGRKFFIKDFINSILVNFKNHYSLRFSCLAGNSVMNRFDSFGLFSCLFFFVKTFSFFSDLLNFFPLSFSLGKLTASDLGFSPGKNASFFQNIFKFGKIFTYLYKIDYFDRVKKGTFLVSQNSFSNNFVFYSDITLLLPSQIFAEQKQFFLNLEGRIRITKKAISSFNMIPSDYKVILSLFLVSKFFLKHNFSIISNFFRTLNFFRNFIKHDSMYLFNLRTLLDNLFNSRFFLLSKRSFLQIFHINLMFLSSVRILNTLLIRFVNNFYEGNLLCENSRTLTLSALKTNSFNFSNFIIN